jgi:hypothetical protein
VPGTGHGRRAGDASSTPARTLTPCSGEALVGDRVVATMASDADRAIEQPQSLK